MGEITAISWTDHTFNPWIGCAKVSPACDGCYAEAMMGENGRYKRVVWGEPGKGAGTRVRTVPSNWAQPVKWNKQARAAGERRFVFCASLADVFDNKVPAQWRADLFDLIAATPHLTWLLLTKRPQMIAELWSEAAHLNGSQFWPRNAAIGTTVEDQKRAALNIPALLAAKAALNPAFAFLSMEPLLGPVDLEHIELRPAVGDYVAMNALTGSGFYRENDGGDLGGDPSAFAAIDWVITGGETDQGGHKARPTHPDWLRAIRDACASEDIPYHHKQNGEHVPLRELAAEVLVATQRCPETAVGLNGEAVRRVGKHQDPHTLDGVLHRARPEVAA